MKKLYKKVSLILTVIILAGLLVSCEMSGTNTKESDIEQKDSHKNNTQEKESNDMSKVDVSQAK